MPAGKQKTCVRRACCSHWAGEISRPSTETLLQRNAGIRSSRDFSLGTHRAWEKSGAQSAFAKSPSPLRSRTTWVKRAALQAFTLGSLRSKETWDTAIEIVRLLLSREPPHSFIMTGCNDTLSVPSGCARCACGAGMTTGDTNGHSCRPGRRGPTARGLHTGNTS